ncbi:MAG: GNAT family N-acetyltransferase [Frankiaceae bacterium]
MAGGPDPSTAAAARLVTARLVLEPLAVGHAAEMVGVLADPSLYAVIGGEPPTLDELTERYGRQVAGPGRAGEAWRNWVVRREGRAVGYVQATIALEDGRWVADVAWLVTPAEQGRGIATEAAARMIQELLSAGVTEIRAEIADHHRASQSVAARLAMRPTARTTSEGERVWVGRRLATGVMERTEDD